MVIIGAGFSGLGAAIALKRAGIEDFAILERADDIGGTWRANTYPDVAVDVPTFSYQFSFELNPNWSRVFAKGSEVKAYIDGIADKYGLRPHLRLRTEVRRREWDEESHLWRIDCGEREVTARFVIAAIGAFIDPRPPDIPGFEDFDGKVLRTQEWEHDYDLTGKRVAVIGTGSTAVQLIPPVARAAGRLHVFQRRAIWVFAKPDYKIPAPVRKAVRDGPRGAERGAARRLRDRRDAAGGDVPSRQALPPAEHRPRACLPRVPAFAGLGPRAATQADSGVRLRVQAPERLQPLLQDVRAREHRAGDRADRADHAERRSSPRTAASARSTCWCWRPASASPPIPRTTASRRCAGATASTSRTSCRTSRSRHTRA